MNVNQNQSGYLNISVIFKCKRKKLKKINCFVNKLKIAFKKLNNLKLILY